MKKSTFFLLVIMLYFISMLSGCGEENTVSPTEVDPYAPGKEWGGGDWPSLKSPSFGDNIIIGAGIPTVTAEYKTDFHPTLTAVRGTDWYIKIIRPEALCTAWYSWQTYGPNWSYELPRFTYHFNFDWTCFNSNSTLTNYDVSWPLTETKSFMLMQNGTWILPQSCPSIRRSVGGNNYDIIRNFTLPTQPKLYLSMVRVWVQGIGSDADRTFPEGPITITQRIKNGVSKSTTEEFVKTTGWSAGIDIKGICAGLNQTFQNSTSHTATFDQETETTETREYNVPANEQWRYIQIYGVERYVFTNSLGEIWTSPDLIANYLGDIDNSVRNVLMIVKYKAGSNKPYSSEFIESASID